MQSPVNQIRSHSYQLRRDIDSTHAKLIGGAVAKGETLEARKDLAMCSFFVLLVPGPGANLSHPKLSIRPVGSTDSCEGEFILLRFTVSLDPIGAAWHFARHRYLLKLGLNEDAQLALSEMNKQLVGQDTQRVVQPKTGILGIFGKARFPAPELDASTNIRPLEAMFKLDGGTRGLEQPFVALAYAVEALLVSFSGPVDLQAWGRTMFY